MADKIKKDNMQVNVDFTNFPELLEMLDEMTDEDMTNRSIFIRRLVKEEFERRNPTHRKTNPKMRALAA